MSEVDVKPSLVKRRTISFIFAFAELRKENTADEVLKLIMTMCASLISTSEDPDRLVNEQIELLRKSVPNMIETNPAALEAVAKARKVRASELRSNKGLRTRQ